MTATARRVDPGWLALRRVADGRAREATAHSLVAALQGYLEVRAERGAVELVDVGAGTGAGAAWLSARIRLAQRWRLVDIDPALLSAASPVAGARAEPIAADVSHFGRLLEHRPADAVTCQALLDLLPQRDLRSVLAPAIACRAAVVASLTVTGVTRLSPRHGDDALVAEAFNAHQQRSGRFGPRATTHAAAILAAAGYAVTTAGTPWLLAGADRALIETWLDGRAAAAADQRPRYHQRITRWLKDRRASAAHGDLRVTVDHLDVLALPPRGDRRRPGGLPPGELPPGDLPPGGRQTCPS
jgi:hypothetical protein